MPQTDQALIALSLPRVEGVNAYTTADEWIETGRALIETGRALYEGNVTGIDQLLQMFAIQARIGGHQNRSVAAQASH